MEKIARGRSRETDVAQVHLSALLGSRLLNCRWLLKQERPGGDRNGSKSNRKQLMAFRVHLPYLMKSSMPRA